MATVVRRPVKSDAIQAGFEFNNRLVEQARIAEDRKLRNQLLIAKLKGEESDAEERKLIIEERTIRNDMSKLAFELAKQFAEGERQAGLDLLETQAGAAGEARTRAGGKEQRDVTRSQEGTERHGAFMSRQALELRELNERLTSIVEARTERKERLQLDEEKHKLGQDVTHFDQFNKFLVAFTENPAARDNFVESMKMMGNPLWEAFPTELPEGAKSKEMLAKLQGKALEQIGSSQGLLMIYAANLMGMVGTNFLNTDFATGERPVDQLFELHRVIQNEVQRRVTRKQRSDLAESTILARHKKLIESTRRTGTQEEKEALKAKLLAEIAEEAKKLLTMEAGSDARP